MGDEHMEDHRKRMAVLEGELSALRTAHGNTRDELLRYRRAMEATSACFLMTDARQCILDVNPALQEQLGYGREELQGRKIDTLYDRTTLQFYAASRDHLSFEADFLCRDGRRVPMLFNRSRLVDERDRIDGYAVFLSDLTELKVVQEI